jgi:prolyl oligopeptidase
VISAANSTYGKLYIKDLTKQDSPISTIVDNFNSDNSVIDSEGTKLYIETDLNAPNKRIVTVDVNNPSASNWLDFIPRQKTFCRPPVAGLFCQLYERCCFSSETI